MLDPMQMPHHEHVVSLNHHDEVSKQIKHLILNISLLYLLIQTIFP